MRKTIGFTLLSIIVITSIQFLPACDPVESYVEDPELEVRPLSLNFNKKTDSMLLEIINTKTGKLDWEISFTEDWITSTPPSGMYADSVYISVDRSGFTSTGSYQTILDIKSKGGSKNIPVSVYHILPFKILEVTPDIDELSIGEVVQFECIANQPDSLHYYWSACISGTCYSSSIIEQALPENNFDQGSWIKWSPGQAGTWKIEVLAYKAEGDHPSDNGQMEIVHYEYNGNFFSRLHCFAREEKGELWDSMIIYVDVEE